jgi:hypothetical protein
MTTKIISVSPTQSKIQVNDQDAIFLEAGGMSTAKMNGGQLAGLRNRIINGDHRVAQRGTGAISCVNGNFTFVTDRWYVQPIGATLNANYNGGSALPDFPTILVATGAAGCTAVNFIQRIESANCRDMASKTVAISFWVFATVGGTIAANIRRADTINNFTTNTLEGSFVLNSTTLPANAWTKFTGTLTLSAAATTGLQLVIATTGAFTSGSVNMTGVQLEIGSVATPFEQRPIGMELALCQRYYYRISAGGVGTVFGTGYTPSTTLADGQVIFPVTMRTPPLALEQNGVAGDYRVNNLGGSTVCTTVPLYSAATTAASGNVRYTTGATLTAGNGIQLSCTSANAYLGFSAEL